MPFGRTGRQNNRSQHAFDSAPASSPGGSSAASAANTQGHPSASPNPAFSSSESFDTAQQLQQQLHLQQQQQHQAPLPPPHTVPVFASSNIGGASNLHNNHPAQLLASNPPAFGGRSPQPQPQPLDFAEQVSRSQSQRYPQVTPLQAQHPFAPASTSVDDLNTTLHAGSPPVAHVQPILPQQPPVPVPESRKSTRKLIKNLKSNFLSGSSTSHRGSEPHQHIPQNSYDNTAGLARRPSKRVSQPPTIRTGVSQVSLEQPLDWQAQAQTQLTQPSPLQGVGEFADRYTIPESNQDLLVQDPLGHPHNTLRRVPTDHETSPYGPDEIGAGHRQQAYLQLQGQASPENQQNPYGQVQYDNSPQQYQYQNSQQLPLQYQGGNQQLLTGHLNTNIQQQNPETVSQLSHESPVTDTDQLSTQNLQSSQTSPAVNYPLQNQAPSLTSQDPAPGQAQSQQSQQPQNMPPPTGQSQRRSQETEKNMRGGQVEPPPGPPPGYRHSQAANMSSLPPPPQQGGGQNPGTYRSSTVTERQFEGNPAEGRNSPQPSASDRDAAAAGQDPDKALKELVVKYKNVKRLYFDGKAQIDQLSGQVETLQNAVANQRMSQSRTSLDDNEYTTRFNRLNGAINNLSFNIRKDWSSLPSWLDKYVSQDALKTGKQEMTAVGRAVISRWVVEEIFNHCFHPGLDPDLSRQLKEIERNIRRFSYKMNSQEEFDALTSKVVNWRMATLEGLQVILNSSDSAQHRADFTQRAATNLTASLFQHLTDPPPPGVDGSASMIVELAIGIAFHLPMESRDVAIIYPLPMDNIVPHIMEVEKTGLPPLETRPSDSSELEGEEGEEGGKEDNGKGGKDRKSRSALPPKDSGKVRFAGFMAVDVRGRQVLVKAPVWTLG